jgi:hypothetical protein
LWESITGAVEPNNAKNEEPLKKRKKTQENEEKSKKNEKRRRKLQRRKRFELDCILMKNKSKHY